MSGSKVLLILGSGGNVGASVASLFSQNGYKVALAARRLKDEENAQGQLHIKADLADPASVESSFDKVVAKFGPPTVVVYNGEVTMISSVRCTDGVVSAASATPVPADSPLDLSIESLTKDMTINTTSVLAAAKKAVEGFERLPSTYSKAFIYTGNFLNKYLMPPLVSLGMGKSATGHLLAVASQAYGPKGYS
jgi:NAD(P)-dependent dehydrogenase (short-subunit alcohol dehydrogenase family)